MKRFDMETYVNSLRESYIFDPMLTPRSWEFVEERVLRNIAHHRGRQMDVALSCRHCWHWDKLIATFIAWPNAFELTLVSDYHALSGYEDNSDSLLCQIYYVQPMFDRTKKDVYKKC